MKDEKIKWVDKFAQKKFSDIKLLENYATFDADEIGKIIEKLVSFIEQVDYSYQKSEHDTYFYESTLYGYESFKTCQKLLMIIKSSRKKLHFYDRNADENKVNKIINEGNAFILSESNYDFAKQIKFYQLIGNKIICLVDFNRFSYVQEFIDILIKYKYDNKLDTIHEQQISRLMTEFILNKKELIEENIKLNNQKEQERLIQEFKKEQEIKREEKEQKELEQILINGLPKKHNSSLIERLTSDLKEEIKKLEIVFDIDRYMAKITCEKPLIMTENIFISTIDIKAKIADPEVFTLVDDGLMGIIYFPENKNLSHILNLAMPYGLYQVDKIGNNYVRFLFLPNEGRYLFNYKIDYKKEWNIDEELNKMYSYLKEFELLSNLSENQIRLYRKK